MNARIILVEDHDGFRRSLSRALTARGLSVRSFACAEELVRIPNAEIEADCLLIDVHLPGTSGIELCRMLRARGLEIPAICMSTDDGEIVRDAALSSGVVAYMQKPFDIATLVELIDRVLSQ